MISFFITLYFSFVLFELINGRNICKINKGIMRYYNCYLDDELTLDNESIDVVIKHINLDEVNISKKRKYPSNGEIRFCLRSILKNIPWVNKIYILTPNETIKYLKDYKEIKDKITYLKDKNLLGFHTISTNVFQFNLWRLKNYGISENFIYLNDDYFIGTSLQKSDFFYIENGKVVPYVLKSDQKINKTLTEEIYYKLYPKMLKKKKISLDNEEYVFQLYGTRLFINELFNNSSKIISKNPNAFGENLFENEEIYKIVLNKYKHADDCLKDSKFRLFQLIYEEFRINYFLNKYNRQTKYLDQRYFDIINKPNGGDLFVINKFERRKHSYSEYGISLVYMNDKFPVPCKYENIESIHNGFYVFETKLKSDMVLTVNDNNTKQDFLLLNDRKNINNQLFYIKYENDNFYSIKNIFNDLYLGISKVTDERNIYTIEFNKKIEDNTQKWYFLSNLKDYYFIVSKDTSNCVLAILGSKSKNNSEIICHFPNGQNNQKFKLINVK